MLDIRELDIREESGRDPNERPDSQNHPEDALDGVAINLTSANAHPRKKQPESSRKCWVPTIPSLPDNSTGNNANVTR